jgi:hypothetical protein
MTTSDDRSRTKETQHVRKRLQLLLGIVSAISLFASAALWTYYDHTRPRVANPVTGRVYSLNTHGSIVYLNQLEHRLVYGLLSIAGVCFVAVLGIEAYARLDRP